MAACGPILELLLDPIFSWLVTGSKSDFLCLVLFSPFGLRGNLFFSPLAKLFLTLIRLPWPDRQGDFLFFIYFDRSGSSWISKLVDRQHVM